VVNSGFHENYVLPALVVPKKSMKISKTKTFRNLIYTTFTKGITVGCWAVTGLVVARNLTPSDYGVIGFASVIIVFAGRFSDMGLGNAVIRRPVLHPNSIQTAFTLKIILSFGAFVLAWLFAPFARHLFQHPATSNLIRIGALSFLVSTVGFAPQALLTREMNYRTLVIPGVAGAVAQCILAVTLVLHGWSYWAVIVANVGATLTGGVTTQFMRKSFVGLRFDWTEAREYLRFCMPFFGSGLLFFLIFNLDNFLVGTSMGSVQLGYYALAFTWGSFICALLQDTVNNVLLPTMATIQHDPAAMRRWYLKTIDLVALVAVVANSTLLVNAHYFLITYLGKGSSKWIPAETSLQILCVYGMLRAVIEVVGPCLLARGETKTLLRASLLIGLVEILLLLLALRSRRIEIVASAVLLAYVCATAVFLPFLRRELSVGISDILNQIWPVGPALVMGILVTSFLPASMGATIMGLAGRGMLTASVVVLTHGLCTRFRCFHEARGMIWPNLARIHA
jgi:O-antigen/teichoic acid export membrane protein